MSLYIHSCTHITIGGSRGQTKHLVHPEYTAFLQCHVDPTCQTVCRVHIVAKEAPGQKVLLQVFLTSNVSSPTTVLSYSLTPQPGFAQESGMDALLPLEVSASSPMRCKDHYLWFTKLA